MNCERVGRVGNLNIETAIYDTEVFDVEFVSQGGNYATSEGGIRGDDNHLHNLFEYRFFSIANCR